MSPEQEGRLARFGLPPLGQMRATTAAVLVDTVGVGLMIPISLLFFTLTTEISVAELGAALTAATVLSLPAGLAGGALTDRFGAKLAMVSNNLVSAAGYALYLLADDLLVVFLAMLLVAVADRMYWACWSSYVHAISNGRPFERWFAFLESVKAGAMGLGALFATLILAVSSVTGARWLVFINVLSSVAAAAMFAAQPMRGPAVADTAGDEGSPQPAGEQDPELLQAVRHWRAVLTSRSGLLLVTGQFLLSPVMLLPSVAFPLLFVDRWHMPAFASTLLFAVATGVSALVQTPLSHAVRFRSRASVISAAMGLLAVALLVMAVLPERRSAFSWAAVVLTGVVLAVVSALYMPASNALLTESAPAAIRGRAVAVFQTASALGMALFPVCFGLAFDNFTALPWILLVVSLVAGAVCFLRASARLPAHVRRPELPAGLNG